MNNINKQIKELHALGMTDKEISDELFMTESSIRSRRARTLKLPLNKSIPPVNMSYRQKQIIIGSLLGDMSCYLKPGPNRNPVLSLKHTTKQKEYFYWKYDELLDVIDCKPYKYTDDRGYEVICFSSRARSEFYLFRDLMYGNQKIVSQKLLKWLTPLSIAVWFMDDGTCRERKDRSDTFSFATYSFSQQENEMLADYLTKHYKIECYVGKKQNGGKYYPHLKVRVNSNERFVKLIEKHVCSSMKYKLGTVLDKERELLENPEEDNQQPSLVRNNFEGSTTSDQTVASSAGSNITTSALHSSE